MGRQACDVNLKGATLQENGEVALAVCSETNKGVDEETVQVLIRELKKAMLNKIEKCIAADENNI